MASEAAVEANVDRDDGPAPLTEISEPETIVMDVAGLFMSDEAYRDGTFPKDPYRGAAYLDEDDEDEPLSGEFFESVSQEPAPQEGLRKRHNTSPGMAALAQSFVTEESGEYELFAAPALNGRHMQMGQGQEADQISRAFESFLQECPGLKASALVDPREDKPRLLVDLTAGEGLREGEFSGRLIAIFERALRSVRALVQHDNLREMQLHLPQDYILVRALDASPLLHIAIVDRHINLGIALVLMRQFERQIQAEAEF